jgi:hypothetical protein
MILRMKFSKVKTSDSFEKTPLKVTGIAFYALTIEIRAIILEYLIISRLSRTFDLFPHL